MSAAIDLLNSTDGQEFQALRARRATYKEICDWVDAAPDKASKRIRKELRYVAWTATLAVQPEDVARSLSGRDGGQP